ncbi:MAG: glycoside hydrolase family 35 protein, partial [Terriglobales bacterium]
MRRRTFLQTAAVAAAWAGLASQRAGAASHRFEAASDGFRLDGRPFILRSGSMHYPRVPRPYWRDRMRKLRALGLNTVCTYVFWNLHEPRPGEFDFTGNLDLAEYIRTAQRAGLFVILRPGPYVCTEWDFGGFPAWLLAPPAMQVRSRDPRFLQAAGRYLTRVGREVGALQVDRGGPIILAQVENEYGSYGSDHVYLGAIRDLMLEAGFTVPLFTSNGPGQRMLQSGSLDGLTSVINFGDTDDPAPAFAELAKFRATGPRMCGEYWDGWFDHWGERHHTTSPARAASGVDWMLSHGCSFNLYMAHGGTSFGFMAGANFGRRYQPDVTSYDYDAPIDEAGRPTPKFHALRAVIAKHLGPAERLPALPAPLTGISVPAFTLAEAAPLAQLWRAPHRTPTPLTMEALGQAYGLIWYRAPVAEAASGQLEITELRDYARLYQGGTLLGTLDRSLGQRSLAVDLSAGIPLDIIVENMGRINFGPKLPDNQQGITASVTLNGAPLGPWEIVPLPLTPLAGLRFGRGPAPLGPAFHRGQITIGGRGPLPGYAG